MAKDNLSSMVMAMNANVTRFILYLLICWQIGNFYCYNARIFSLYFREGAHKLFTPSAKGTIESGEVVHPAPHSCLRVWKILKVTHL